MHAPISFSNEPFPRLVSGSLLAAIAIVVALSGSKRLGGVPGPLSLRHQGRQLSNLRFLGRVEWCICGAVGGSGGGRRGVALEEVAHALADGLQATSSRLSGGNSRWGGEGGKSWGEAQGFILKGKGTSKLGFSLRQQKECSPLNKLPPPPFLP